MLSVAVSGASQYKSGIEKRKMQTLAHHIVYSQSPASSQNALGKNESVPRMDFLRPNLNLIWLFIISQDIPIAPLLTGSVEGGRSKVSWGRDCLCQDLEEIVVSSALWSCDVNLG